MGVSSIPFNITSVLIDPRIHISHVTVMRETGHVRRCRVWLLVPVECLDRFDAAIRGYYPSRSEAIRYGMALVLREVASMRRNSGDPLEATSGPACVEVGLEGDR